MTDPAVEVLLSKGRRLAASGVQARLGGIQVGDQLYTVKHLRIIPQKDITVEADGRKRRYRGSIDVFLKENQKMLVVNTIDLERYVKGVLYHEISNRWPMEATKAQAVAVRTYALHQIKKSKNALYDVTSDIYSQVYGGKSAERYRTNIAADRTAGEVMLYAGKILPAYYHASCGGHTEDARNLWGQNLPPLKGVVCSFCRFAPHSLWKKNFRSKDIQDRLNAGGYKMGLIAEVAAAGRNESGRILDVRIADRDGKNVRIPANKFRELIGPNIIKSNNYEIFMKGYYFDLEGRGWGHGVGMCQWGAHFMSRQRHSYQEILEYYYPGTEITDYRRQDWTALNAHP